MEPLAAESVHRKDICQVSGARGQRNAGGGVSYYRKLRGSLPSSVTNRRLAAASLRLLTSAQWLSIPKILFALNLRKLEDIPVQTAIHPPVALRELEPLTACLKSKWYRSGTRFSTSSEDNGLCLFLIVKKGAFGRIIASWKSCEIVH